MCSRWATHEPVGVVVLGVDLDEVGGRNLSCDPVEDFVGRLLRFLVRDVVAFGAGTCNTWARPRAARLWAARRAALSSARVGARPR